MNTEKVNENRTRSFGDKIRQFIIILTTVAIVIVVILIVVDLAIRITTGNESTLGDLVGSYFEELLDKIKRHISTLTNS